MKRIIKIDTEIPCNDVQDTCLKQTHYAVTKYFDDSSRDVDDYSFINSYEIKEGNNILSNAILRSILLPETDLLDQVTRVEFNNCVFTEGVDLNFRDFNGNVVFKNCIFDCDVTLLGFFYGYISFEQSSFINAKINFQECLFDNFNFRLATLNGCDVCFQETEFRDETILFSDMHLHSSSLRFINTIFPTSAKLFNFLAVEADSSSRIQFHLVDFDFREFRLFGAKISSFIFAECTFNCNRFEWECECGTLILQKCRNFRIMNLESLKGLKNLNIYGFINTGKVILGNDVNYYIEALKTSRDILWIGKDEYRSTTLPELKSQLFTLSDFFQANQSGQREIVNHEIKIIEREEQMMSEQGLKMRIFLSYAWKDEALADSID